MTATLFFAGLAGCWSSQGTNGNGNPLADGGIPDLGDRICNAIQIGNAFIQPMDTGNATVPAPTGGALADGSYHLTASSYYPSLSTAAGCAAAPTTTKLIVSSSSATSGTLQSATLTITGYFVSESTSYLINDTSLSAHIDCIAPDPLGLVGNAFQTAYSATPTEVQLYASGDCGNHIEVYDLD